jgi:hypothetical protein
MKLLHCTLGKEWVEIAQQAPATVGLRVVPDENRQRLDRLLVDVTTGENLLVLTGLGASRAVKDGVGKSLAPSMEDLWATVRDATGPNFDVVKLAANYATPADGDNIEHLLSQCQLAYRLHGAKEIESFISDAEKAIVRKCSFITTETNLDTHGAFLRKVARRSTRLPRMRLFTLNYDLCFETAASRSRFVVVDGFSHYQPQEFDGSHFSYDYVRREQSGEAPDYIPNVFHLYKLHGSLDWERSGGQVVKRDKPKKPLLIYPRYSKFESSYDQPFLEMMSQFQLALRQPNAGLLVIGFGFNDAHIHQPVLAAVRSNVGLKVVVVAPDLVESTKQPVKDLVALAKGGDHRIALMEATFEELTEALPDLVAATDEERHRDRIRKLGGAR